MKTLLWIALVAYLVAPVAIAPIVCGVALLWRAIKRALTPNVMVIRVPVPVPIKVPVHVMMQPPGPPPPPPEPRQLPPAGPRRNALVDFQGTKVFGLVHYVVGDIAFCRKVKRAMNGMIEFDGSDLHPWPVDRLRVLEQDYCDVESVSPAS